MAYVIVTDTALDIEEEFLAQHGICTVPFTFTLDQYDTVEDDFGKTVPYEVVYQQLQQPKDSLNVQLSGISLTSVFEGVLKSNRDVLYFGTSSGLHDSFRAACRVRDILNRKYHNHQVYCADTLCIAGGHALLIRELLKRKALGDAPTQMIQWAQSFSENICHWFVSSQTSGWRKSSAETVSFLNRTGGLSPYKKVRTRRKALELLAKQFYDHVQQLDQYPVVISHSGCPEDAEYLAQYLLQSSDQTLKQVECYLMNPVMASYVGKGAVGLFFYGDGRGK